jgi:hypothetical protein
MTRSPCAKFGHGSVVSAQDIGRLDVLVDEAAPVDLCERRSDRDGEAQKAPHLHGHPEQSVQRLAVGVLEHQHGPTALADELERSHRPRPARPSMRIRKQGDRGWRVSDAPQRAARPARQPDNRRRASLFCRRRVHRPATRTGGYYHRQRRTKRMEPSAGDPPSGQ